MDYSNFRIAVNNDQPLEDGSYEATLEGIEQRETRYGTKLMWKFRVDEPNTEVVGWTNPSPSKRSRAFEYATALNPALASQNSWGPEDVISRDCVLVVEIVEGEDGRIKNKILKVNPSR
jgi:hypothetical protein